MRELSLFSGGGGGVYGSKLLEWKTIGYVEYDDYCQRIIAQRIRDGIFDSAPIFGDIRTFAALHASSYRGLVDVVTAGFPCQPFSTAGKQRGSDDERNMWPATLEVIRAVRPKCALLENVPGLLGKHRYFETILKDLSEAGYDARWVCLSAAEVGAPHKRERLWIMCTDTNRSEKFLVNAESNGLAALHSSRCGKKGADARIPAQSRRAGCGNYQWWATEPDVGRVADGVASRRDRLKSLGNGQVPAVFAEAWRILNG